jgi:DNA-binding CsgD family transcriptional regulator
MLNDTQSLAQLIYLSDPYTDWRDKLRHIVAEMAKKFQAEDAVFFSQSQKQNEIDWENSFSLYSDKSYLGKYVGYYRHLDPLYPAQFNSKPSMTVFKTDDIIPYSELMKLEYYNDFLRPQKQCKELIIRLCSSLHFFGVIALQRSEKQSNFNNNNMLIARSLTPHLLNMFQNEYLLSKIYEEHKLLECWLESQAEGIILLDNKMQPMYCNSIAKEISILMSHNLYKPGKKVNGSDSEDFPIPREIIQDCVELKKQFRQKDDYGYPVKKRIINTVNGRFYAESRLNHYSCQWASSPGFTVYLRRVDDAEKISREITHNEYILTKRELDVIQCVTEGLTNREIAEKLFISEFTVETHLKNILTKTGFRNRTQLASRIQSMNSRN